MAATAKAAHAATSSNVSETDAMVVRLAIGTASEAKRPSLACRYETAIGMALRAAVIDEESQAAKYAAADGPEAKSGIYCDLDTVKAASMLG